MLGSVLARTAVAIVVFATSQAAGAQVLDPVPAVPEPAVPMKEPPSPDDTPPLPEPPPPTPVTEEWPAIDPPSEGAEETNDDAARRSSPSRHAALAPAKRQGTFELTAMAYMSMGSKYVHYRGIGLRAGFEILDWLGVEATTSVPGLLSASYGATVYELYDYLSYSPNVVDLKRMEYFASVGPRFSVPISWWSHGVPFHGDAYLTTGVGLALLVDSCVPNRDGCSDDIGIGRGLRKAEGESTRMPVTYHLGGGLHVHLLSSVSLTMEIRSMRYSDTAVDAGAEYTKHKKVLFSMVGLGVLL